MPGTITSADAVIMLSVDGLFDYPQQLSEFSTDDIFSTGQVTSAELQLGADGAVAAGWLPNLKTMTFMFLASSVSIPLFELWSTTQDQQRVLLQANGNIILNSTGCLLYTSDAADDLLC